MWLDCFDNQDTVMFHHVEDWLILKAGSMSLVTYAPIVDLAVKDGEFSSRAATQLCDSPRPRRASAPHPRVEVEHNQPHQTHDALPWRHVPHRTRLQLEEVGITIAAIVAAAAAADQR